MKFYETPNEGSVMKTLLCLTMLFSFSAFAEKKAAKKPNPDMNLLGRIDEKTLNAEANNTVKPVEVANAETSKVSFGCKDSTGKQYKQGEPGYEACFSNIKAQHDMNKMNKNNNNQTNADANSGTVNFKIGD
jgi:hypothetical protein